MCDGEPAAMQPAETVRRQGPGLWTYVVPPPPPSVRVPTPQPPSIPLKLPPPRRPVQGPVRPSVESRPGAGLEEAYVASLAVANQQGYFKSAGKWSHLCISVQKNKTKQKTQRVMLFHDFYHVSLVLSHVISHISYLLYTKKTHFTNN